MNEKKRHLVYLDAWSIDHEPLSIDELNTPFSFIALTHFPWSISFLRKYLLSNGLRDMERSIAHRFSILHGTFLVNYWITTIQFTNQRFLSFFVSLRSMIIVPIAMHFLSMIKLYSFKTSTFGKERGKERLSSRDFNVWNTLVRNVSRCLKQILCSRAITYIYIYIFYFYLRLYIYINKHPRIRVNTGKIDLRHLISQIYEEGLEGNIDILSRQFLINQSVKYCKSICK